MDFIHIECIIRMLKIKRTLKQKKEKIILRSVENMKRRKMLRLLDDRGKRII